MNPQTVISFLAVLTLASNITAVFLIGFYILSRKNKSLLLKWKKIDNLLSLYLTELVFLISTVATLGSLFFSEVAKFEPCKLCWFQRIFMYPLPIMLGISLWKRYKDVFNYVLALSLIGLAIAIYHYYSQMTGNPLVPCSTVGFSVSCSERFFTYYGYITIPWMSFSAFSYIFLLGLLSKKTN